MAAVSQHSHADTLHAAEVLDDGGHVEVTPVPHRDLAHLHQEITHPQPALAGRPPGMEAADEGPHGLSVLVTWSGNYSLFYICTKVNSITLD